MPLSRIAPTNGTVDVRWGAPLGFYAGASLRWALSQTRLAPSDYGDQRIPYGGTRGFAVADARAGWRLGRQFLVAVVVENLADAPYRYHGSSIAGPGRGVLVSFETGL